MKIVREPTIYVIGRPAIDDEDVARFLSDSQTTWQTDTDVSAERLSELAGRVCYMSFGKSQGRKSNDEYLENIMEQQHGCYDEQTDVLTAQGWKPWPSVTEEDELATRTPDGMVVYERPSRLIRYEYQGRMYRVEATGVDLLVTPNHNLFVCPTTTKEGRRREHFALIKAEELEHRSHAYCKFARWEPQEDAIDDELMAMFLGFAIGDGTVIAPGNRVSFHLRRARKISWLLEFVKLADIPLHVAEEEYTVTLPEDWRPWLARMYASKHEKVIPQRLLLQATNDTLQALLDGLLASDGSYSPTGELFDTTSFILAGQLQQLALHLGFTANISQTDSDRERNTSSFGNRPIYRVYLIRRNLKPEVNKWAGCEGHTCWVENWSGIVYCAEVSNHIVFVRRNGKPVWCGNSVLEHAVWNFLVTGVSRSFTHELVRHRTGVAYSQLSQRFVDESDVDFVEPGVIASDPALDAIWQEAIEAAQAAYQALSEKLVERIQAAHPDLSKREKRKMAREAARSVLPNATETKIVFSANARALRHIIELRGAAGTEPEIRRFAVKMLRIMQTEAPHLFADFAIVTLPDGSEGVKAAYHKV